MRYTNLINQVEYIISMSLYFESVLNLEEDCVNTRIKQIRFSNTDKFKRMFSWEKTNPLQ